LYLAIFIPLLHHLLKNHFQTLGDPSVSPEKRQKALKYLVHFVGDLHQPLHAGQNHDPGGNDVKVEFLAETVNPYTKKPWNLHQV
jgi:hypothetical protein